MRFRNTILCLVVVLSCLTHGSDMAYGQSPTLLEAYNRFNAYYQGGERTLIEIEDWRQVDGPDICLSRQDYITLDENLRGAGHHMPEWALRLRMRNVRFYSTPLMRLLHMAHPWNCDDDARIAEVVTNAEYIKRKYGPYVWHVGSTSNTFVRDQTLLAGPLTHTSLTYLAHLEVPSEDRPY